MKAAPFLAIPLKIARKFHSIANPDSSAFGRNWKMLPMKEYANELIFNVLSDEKPAMIARLGSTEMLCMANYLGVQNPDKFKNYGTFIKGQSPPWWWENGMINQMQQWSGFFPPTVEKIVEFCELMRHDMPECDILGSWQKVEKFYDYELRNSKKVMLEDLEPFFSSNPWTRALKDKKVLVVHPFSETIQIQYLIREKIFPGGLIPEFDLQTIKAVQSIAGEKTPFNDWFEALNSMKEQILSKDFDICILGCGAYGFPLAAYVKRLGKKAIHLGGVTQLLFGIKGKRWENYIVYPYANLYNDHWVRPGEGERPKMSGLVEDSCYW